MEIIVILIIIAAAAAAEAFLYSKTGGRKLSYTARLERQEVYEGDSVTLTEELNNGKALPLPFVKTEIIAPDKMHSKRGVRDRLNLSLRGRFVRYRSFFPLYR